MPVGLTSYATSSQEMVPLNQLSPATKSNRIDPRLLEGPKVPIEELMSLVRHAKFALVKDALDYLPNKRFDKALVLPVSDRTIEVVGCYCTVRYRTEHR